MTQLAQYEQRTALGDPAVDVGAKRSLAHRTMLMVPPALLQPELLRVERLSFVGPLYEMARLGWVPTVFEWQLEPLANCRGTFALVRDESDQGISATNVSARELPPQQLPEQEIPLIRSAPTTHRCILVGPTPQFSRRAGHAAFIPRNAVMPALSAATLG